MCHMVLAVLAYVPYGENCHGICALWCLRPWHTCCMVLTEEPCTHRPWHMCQRVLLGLGLKSRPELQLCECACACLQTLEMVH